MKKFLLTTFLVLALFAINLQAQNTSGYPSWVRGNSGVEMRMDFMLDSTASSYDSIATGWQDISDYDATNEYIQLFYKITRGTTGAGDTTAVLCDVWGNESASWTNAVNIVQLVDTATFVIATTLAATYSASQWSNKRPKYINIVWENQSLTGNLHGIDDSVSVSAVLRFPLKDAKIDSE